MRPAYSLHMPASTPVSPLVSMYADRKCPFLGLHRDQLFCPSIASANGLNPESFAILEIPKGSYIYRTIIEFAVHFAVDLNTPEESLVDNPHLSEEKLNSPKTSSPPAVDEKTGNTAKIRVAKTKRCVRGFDNVSIQRREGPGRLSSIMNSGDLDFGWLSLSDDDSASDNDRDYEAESDDNDSTVSGEVESDEDGLEHKSTLSPRTSLGVLKEKRLSDTFQKYQMGIGYAKVKVDGKKMLIHHCAYGLPVPDSLEGSLGMFKTVVLAGENDFQLKQLCAVANSWNLNRVICKFRPPPGRFNLRRFKMGDKECGSWEDQGSKLSRPAKSVILQEGQLESIVNDIKEFVSADTQDWYLAHGIPHRRSFLFHGPPGCGKTSTIKMICGMFGFNACFLGLTSINFSNQALQDALETLPARCLLVLEDVDVLFGEDRKSEVPSSLTFSGLLNALDGLVSVDGIVRVFTTNHIEKLDQALIRGGRVDRRFEFDHPNAKQLATIFKSFYENCPDALAKRFADCVLSRPEVEARSIATIQEHFIYTRKFSAEESVDMIPKFFAEFYPKAGCTQNSLYV